MKKLLFVLCVVLGIGSLCFAASENATVLMNKQVKILYNEAIQEFQNVKGEKVYPLSYQGTTYLPIRAISSMFYAEIRWDGETNSIYLFEGELDETSAHAVDEFVAGDNEEVEAMLNQDITIYIGEDVQAFTDANGVAVYPLSYQGTTYLPVRAVAELFGLSIDWDADENAVIINEDFSDEGYDDGEDDEYVSDDEFGGSDEELEAEAQLTEESDEETEAIEVEDGIYMFYDENGIETYYYFTDDDDVIFYQLNEDGDMLAWRFDENGEMVYFE